MTERVTVLKKRLAATAAVFLAILSALSVFMVTNAVILPKDSLSRFVPHDSIGYLHADLTAPVRPRSQETIDVPFGMGPDEAARFVALSNGQLESGWILAWHRHGPSVAERERLADEGAVQLLPNGTAWIIAPQDLVDRCRESLSRGSTLANDPKMSKGLKLARDLYPVQFMLNPNRLPETGRADPVMDDFRQMGPIVGSSSDQEFSRGIVLAFPDSGPPEKGILSQKPDIFWGEGAVLAYAGENTDTNWMAVVFGQINDWRISLGLDPAGIPNPKTIHDGRVSMVFFPTEKDRPEFTVRLEETDLEEIYGKLRIFLDRVVPGRQVTNLPDGDRVIELVTVAGTEGLGTGESIQSGITVNITAKPEFYLHLRQEGRDVAMYSSQRMIDLPKNRVDLTDCGQHKGNRLITQNSYFSTLLNLLGVNNGTGEGFRLFIEKQYNLWITCRLSTIVVDNLQSN